MATPISNSEPTSTNFAADLVAEVAAHNAAQRPHREPDAQRRERQQRGGQRVGLREENLAEVQRRGGCRSDEVVGLDDRPN